MKKVILFYVFILFTSLSFYSCRTDDLKISKQVETTLVENNIMATSSVKNGIVTLEGEVESEAAKLQAEEMMKSIKGVKRVVNNLAIVVPAPPKVEISPDDSLKIAVTTAIEAAGFKGITATVKDGEVTLSGDVKNADLKKIMQIANESKPKKVINELKIKK